MARGGYATLRIDDTRQNQQQLLDINHAYLEQTEACYQDVHQASYLQGYYSDRGAASAAAHETLSPSHTGSSTPRKMLQNRRVNMMQRRIEMRQRSEERQRQQQQMRQSNERSSSHDNQSHMNSFGTRQPQHQVPSQEQSQPQYHVQRQAQHMSLSHQDGGRQPNNNSILKGQSFEYQGRQRQYQNNAHHHQPSQSYPISPPNDQRPSSDPASGHRPRPNFYPRTQPQRQNVSQPNSRQQQEYQQSSPQVTSPPVLDRKQDMHKTLDKAGEYPSANLFNGNEYPNNQNYSGQYQNDDDHDEGIEVDAQQFLLQSNPGNSSRIPQSHESPSDEILVEDGYYEDEIQQCHTMAPKSREQQWLAERAVPMSQQQYQSMQQQPRVSEGNTYPSNQLQQHQQRNTQQQVQFSENNFLQQPASIEETNERKQNQPQRDWHSLNRNRLYQKQFAARYQNAASNASPKYQSQSIQQLRSSTTKQPNVANFSPIESLSNRTDQIQRKQRQPSHHDESFESIGNATSGQADEGEESVASVMDRARSFEASYARKYANIGELRSKSVPRERSVQWPSNELNHTDPSDPRPVRERRPRSSQESQPQFIDDDTMTESVASRKKDWEGRLQSGQQRKARSPPENEAFGVWTERANRLAQQRKSEQRHEQRRSIEEKWRRTAVKSLPPERRNRPESEIYSYGPSEDREYRGEHHADQYSIEQESSHMSIEDRRRMLWDGKERLRAVLPKASSFDSANRPPDLNCSPGSGSAGSSFFKSKFVHAAAVATQQKANLGANENPTQNEIPAPRVSPKRHWQKVGAVSSHFTDSTAGTTPVGSNSSSYRTQSTNVSRMTDQYRKQSIEQNNPMQPRSNERAPPQARPEPRAEINERAQSGAAASHGNKVSVMPSIAETPRSSVADLIARINAVSRSNPAEALAAIDSIIKAECGVSNSGKAPVPKSAKSAQSPFSQSRPSETEQATQPLGKDFSQPKYEEKMQATAENEDDEDEDDSLLSDDSTVSSMTNPTYQSIPVHSPPTVSGDVARGPGQASNPPSGYSGSRAVKKQPQYSRPVFDDFEVKTSRGKTQLPPQVLPSQNKTRDSVGGNPNPYPHRQYQKQKRDIVDSKPSNDSPEDKGDRRFVETTIGGLNYRLSASRSMNKSKSEDEALQRNNSNVQERPSNKPPVNSSTDNLDSAWVPVPKNDYFQPTFKSNICKPAAEQRQKEYDSKPSTDRLVQPQQKNESKYVSHSDLNQGQTAGLPSVVSDAFSGLPSVISDAFSGIDIDLEEEHGPPPINRQGHVDIEPKKSVSQRRQELEHLSRTWNQKSPGVEEEDQMKPSPSKERLASSQGQSSRVANQDWAITPEEKKKAKVEPNLRLKGSKKLAQKFANLVKAFESDA